MALGLQSGKEGESCGSAGSQSQGLQRPVTEPRLLCQRNSEGQTEVGTDKSKHTIPVARKHASNGQSFLLPYHEGARKQTEGATSP